MKSHITLLLLLTTCVISAQNIKIDDVKTEYVNIFNSYCITSKTGENINEDNATSKIAFGKQYKDIMTTAVVGSNDVVNSGNAFSYTYDKNKKTISANGVFMRSGNFVYDVGLSLKDEDDALDFYSKGAWQKDIGIKLGGSYVISFTQFYHKDSCNVMRVKRGEYIEKKLRYIDSLIKNKDKIEAIKDAFEKNNPSSDPAIGTDYKEYRVALKNLAELKNLDDAKNKGKLKEYLEEDVASFDYKNRIFHGYRIFWANLNGSYVNSAIKFTNDDIINTDYQEKYKSFSKFTIEGNLNLQQYGYRLLQFANLFGRLNRGSFVDEPSLKGKTYSIQEIPDGNDTYYNVLAGGEVVQRYDNLKKPLMHMEVGGSYVMLFYKKIVGLNVRASYNFPFQSTVIDFTNNYTLMGGLVARLNKKDKWSATTILLNGGVESEPFETKAWKNFVLKASVSIPFSFYEPKK